jgi:multidrug resistance efflux pump
VAEFDRHDTLNRLDDYKAQVVQAEASMKTIRAQLEVIRKAHEQSIQVSEAELDKARLDLKTIPVRSAIDAEVLRLAAEEAEARHKQLLNEVELMGTSLKAQLRIASLTLDEAKVELKRIEADTDRMLIRAPIDGIVVMRSIWRAGEQGQIQAGDQLHRGQPFMRIVDPDSMVVNATVNQVDSELIRIGAKASVYFDAYPDLELPATVYSIGAMTKAVGRRGGSVKVVPVSLKLEAIDPRVIPDLSTSVDVVLGTAKNALIAPLEAILSGQPGGGPYVLLQRPSGWERHEVELGLASNVAVVVRSGLEAGDVMAAQRPPAGAKK